MYSIYIGTCTWLEGGKEGGRGGRERREGEEGGRE